jgi:hypothetical protein
MHIYIEVVLGGVMISVFAIRPKVREFKHGRGRWVFKGYINLQHAVPRRLSKAVGPKSPDFAAC